MRTFDLLISAMVSVCLCAGASGAPSVSLSNKRLSLSFDKATGAWTGFVDRSTGRNLLTGEGDAGFVPRDKPITVDAALVRRALASGKAVSLEGEWLYSPAEDEGDAPTRYAEARPQGGRWAPTPVPSRAGEGDNRLHDRVGDFWYRGEVVVPKGLGSGDLVLVIGAVDDTDETFVNDELVGRTGVETPHNWESARFYRVPAELIRRGRPNVVMVKVHNGAFDGGIAGPVVLGAPDVLRKPEPPAPPLLSHHADAGSIRLTARQGDLEYEIEYRLLGEALLARRLTVRNAGANDAPLNGVPVAIPALSMGANQTIAFPGSIPAGDIAVSKLATGEAIGPRGMDPLAIVWDAARKQGVGVWYDCEDEWAPVSAVRTERGVAIRHNQQITGVLKPDESVRLGTQYIWFASGSRDAALRGVQQVYKLIGLKAPSRGLPALREKILYCGHPGGTPELNYRSYGGFRALMDYTPTLKRLGVDILWLLPIWEHGDGAQWNLYSPFDHFQVSPLYGTPGELKQLSSMLKGNGMGLMFDLVPHGPPDFTPLAKEHPDWVCRDKDGKPAYEWSQYAFDYSNPGWMDYMSRAAEVDAREYDAIGARVDCGAGGVANWDPNCGHRPSQSTLWAGMKMDKAIRDGFLRVNKSTILMPEEYSGANVFYRVSDLTYDAQLFFLMVDLKARNASPSEWARSLQDFLRDQSLTLPEGGLKMRFISNHDTVSWTFQAKRPAEVYGVEHTRALLALCALIDGVPMLYQGDEDSAVYRKPGVSNVDFLSRVYGIRKSTPAIRHGTADYSSVTASGGVFACLRSDAKAKAVILVSFSPSETKSAVSSAIDLTGVWIDKLSGEKLTLTGRKSTIPMRPYQTRVLVRSSD